MGIHNCLIYGLKDDTINKTISMSMDLKNLIPEGPMLFILKYKIFF